jgi:hypothetical protein
MLMRRQYVYQLFSSMARRELKVFAMSRLEAFRIA